MWQLHTNNLSSYSLLLIRYDRYIRRDAELELNIGMESKRPLEGIPDLDDIPKDVFDIAVAEVSKLIESDVYPRYESLQCTVLVRNS